MKDYYLKRRQIVREQSWSQFVTSSRKFRGDAYLPYEENQSRANEIAALQTKDESPVDEPPRPRIGFKK